MEDRAEALALELELRPHPEGGRFRRVFASESPVVPEDGRGPRPALTSIYYLLRGDEHSRWHRVRSDEAWHFYEGSPLELLLADPRLENLHRLRLGPTAGEARPVAVVPAGWWQAARPTAGYALVGCSVGPGFDEADFGLMRDDPAAADALRTHFPELISLL